MAGPQTTPIEPRRNERDIDPQRWVDRHGDYLYSYALRTVRRAEAAEDLVQETLLAAWRGRAGFVGRAKERTWLTAILKRRVIDWLRRTVRERSQSGGESDGRAVDPFDKRGMWRAAPKRWKSDAPDSDADREEFWAVIRRCSDKLSPRLRDAFVLWHLDERAGEDVCREIGINPSNLWVMLYRARLGMWQCLSKHWYGQESSDREGGEA